MNVVRVAQRALFLVLGVQCCLGTTLKLLTSDPINVDGTGNTGSTHLRIKNTDPKQPSTCTLFIKDFISTNTNGKMGVTATFYDKDMPTSAGRAVGPTIALQAAANEEFSIKVDFAHMVEAGESKGDLYCGDSDTPIGTLAAIKQLGLPFKVSVNENPQEKPELAFIDGQSLSVQLRNDDPVTYPFTWEMLIKGKSKKGSGQIGPNGVATIPVTPDPDWFSPYQSFFKDEPVDGKLTLRYQPKGAQSEDFYPAKPIPIKARLSSFTPGRREAQSTIVILLVLAFGGILSSYFNVDLVNRLRMVGIKKRLGKLVKETGEISPQLTSQLRVTLLLEHKRVVADLPKGVFFTPETASVLAQSATDTDGLEMRVNLAVQIADAAARLGRGTDTGMIAQSLADRVDRDLSSAQDLLRKSTLSAAEQQKVQTGIADAVNVLDALDAPDTALEETLAARVRDLQARFTDAVKGDPIYVQIKSQAPVPFLLLTPGRSAGSQAERDASSLKLKVVADLIEMQAKPSTEMIDALRRQDPHSVRSAELLLRELKDEVTPEDLRNAIQASPPQFSILIDRDVVRVNRASLMRVVFNNQRYNQASAKSLIECTWHFGHLNLTERGWEVFHYFPAVRPEPYQVDVTFKDEKQKDIPQGIPVQSLSIEVQPPYSEGSPHWAIEIQRWLIGFLVAVLGLFAGAKDKITTLDTLGTLFAIFLLGFAVDMAKNLILPKTS